MADFPTKYVYLSGPSEIRINVNGELELYYYDEAGIAIINEDNPFVLNVKPNEGRLRFISSVILGELSEVGFGSHKTTLEILAPGITWDTAEEPTVDTMPLMNPIKPPTTTIRPRP
jgi:hypothetical protein